MSPFNPSPQISGNDAEEEAESLQEPEGADNTKKMRTPKSANTHELI